MRRFVFAAFTLTVLAACQPTTTELTEEQKAEIAAEVGLLVPQFFDAFRDGDFDRGIEFWLDAPDAAAAANGRVVHGYDNIVSVFRPGFERVASQLFNVSGQRIVVLAPDVVAVYTESINSQTFVDGETSPEVHHVMLGIWVKHDGEWKIHLGHESSRRVEDSEGP